jgi:hypothetical protein
VESTFDVFTYPGEVQMRSLIFSILHHVVVLLAILVIPAASYAVPLAVLDPASPGLNGVYPFMGPDSFGNTYFAYPTQWGGFNGGSGITLSGDGRLTNDADGGFVRYNTTMQGQNPAAGQYTTTAMNPSQDWVMSMEWQSNMTATSGTVFELSHATNDVARLNANGAGLYQLLAGDGTAGYAVIDTYAPGTVLLPNTVHTLTLHYKTANQLLDFYIDGILEAANFPARGTSPAYGANFLQLGGGRTVDSGNPAPVDYFDNVKIGIIPEPSSYLLMVLGSISLVVLRWKSIREGLNNMFIAG